jgi:hypothetical protein
MNALLIMASVIVIGFFTVSAREGFVALLLYVLAFLIGVEYGSIMRRHHVITDTARAEE